MRIASWKARPLNGEDGLEHRARAIGNLKRSGRSPSLRGFLAPFDFGRSLGALRFSPLLLPNRFGQEALPVPAKIASRTGCGIRRILSLQSGPQQAIESGGVQVIGSRKVQALHFLTPVRRVTRGARKRSHDSCLSKSIGRSRGRQGKLRGSQNIGNNRRIAPV